MGREGKLPSDAKLFHVRFAEGYERAILMVITDSENPPVIGVFNTYEDAARFCLRANVEVPVRPPVTYSKEDFFKELQQWRQKDPRIAGMNLSKLVPYILEAEKIHGHSSKK